MNVYRLQHDDPMDVYAAVAKMCLAERRRLGLNRREFSRLCGVAHTSIYKAEDKHSGLTTVRTLALIAAACGKRLEVRFV